MQSMHESQVYALAYKMASSVPRAFRPPCQLIKSCRKHPFTTSSRRHANAAQNALAQRQQKRVGKVGPSVNTMRRQQAVTPEGRKEYLAAAEDQGLFQGIYIKPTGKKLPSWLDYKQRFAIEWLHFRLRAVGTYSLGVIWWTSRKNPPIISHKDIGWTWKSWIPFNYRWSAPPVAQARRLHSKLFKHIASGLPEDLAAIKEITTQSFYGTLSKALLARKDNRVTEWKNEGYTRWPRLMQERVGQMPANDSGSVNGIRQAIVRLVSKQKHEVWELKNKEPHLVKSSNKEVTENMILQQRIVDGKMQPWKVVGFAESMTPDEYQKYQDEIGDRHSAMQKYQERMGGPLPQA